MRILTDRDTDTASLGDRSVSVIGYGSQGAAQALNLRDSGVDVTVGLRQESASREAAEAEGLRVEDVARAASADVVALLVPDEVAPDVLSASVSPNMAPGATLVFSHGFAVRYGYAELPSGVDVVMVAPMGPGQRLRERYVEGGGLPASFAVERDASGRARETALAYARAIGCSRVGLFETTFGEETEIDLFAEQAVLVGGLMKLVEAGFDVLVEAGYSPELAYMECLYEIRLTADLLGRYGPAGMMSRISPTALFGGLRSGAEAVGEPSREGMRRILERVRNGSFAEEFVKDSQEGGPALRSMLDLEADAPISKAAERLRDVAHGPGGGAKRLDSLD